MTKDLEFESKLEAAEMWYIRRIVRTEYHGLKLKEVKPSGKDNNNYLTYKTANQLGKQILGGKI